MSAIIAIPFRIQNLSEEQKETISLNDPTHQDMRL